MHRNLFNTKVKIETIEKKLSDDNIWISDYIFWNELWAAISIKDISSRRVLYFFAIKWRMDFPNNFRVVVRDKIFMPTQRPILDPSNDLIMFHALVNQEQKEN